MSQADSGPGHGERAFAPIDLTGNKDDPIEDDVDPELQQQLADAIEKWYPELDKRPKREDLALASTFLQCMNSTLCFLTVSFRMLSKAPWKSKMITTHIRQAALAAIVNGWFVWSDKQCKIPFTRAELALAAVSYRGCLQPRMPDDPAQSIFPMIDCLPTDIECKEMFSQGNCFCPFCGNQRVFAVPTFATAATWRSPSWTNLHQALLDSEAFPWRTSAAWHKPSCTRDEVTVRVTKFGPWALLLFRPHESSLYPPLREMTVPLTDAAVAANGLAVHGFLCTDIHGEHGRHFWFVEPTSSGAAYVYDSLKGLQQLTVELSRTLYIVGVLLLSVKCDKPVLTNAKLCQAAGKVPLHQKSDRPIRVAARSKRQAPKSIKNRTSRRKRDVGRKAAKRSNTAHKKSSERSVGKAKKGTTSRKRPLRSLRSGPFCRQCTEDPDGPISDGEICLRPNKQLRNTPEKRERKEPCPTIEICRVSDRAGKASPSAIGVGKGLGHVTQYTHGHWCTVPGFTTDSEFVKDRLHMRDLVEEFIQVV